MTRPFFMSIAAALLATPLMTFAAEQNTGVVVVPVGKATLNVVEIGPNRTPKAHSPRSSTSTSTTAD